MLHRKATRGED